MVKQIIDLSTANDGQGDTLRDGGVKINANFDEVYADVAQAQTDITSIQGDVTQAQTDIAGNTTKITDIENSIRIPYTFKSDGADSLVHLAPGFAVNTIFETEFYDISTQPGSGARWRIREIVDPANTTGIGDVIDNVFGPRLVGVNYIFQLQYEQGELDLVKLDVNLGGDQFQQTNIQRVISAAKLSNTTITGFGTFHATQTVNFGPAHAELEKVMFRPHMGGLSRNDYSATGTPAGFESFYTGVESGVDTVDIKDENGNALTVGKLLNFGGNMASNSLPLRQELFWHGDGNADHTRRSTCVGYVTDADGALDRIDANHAYSAGLVIDGSTEVKTMDVGSANSLYGVYLAAGSQDELTINLQSKGNNMLVGSVTKLDASVNINYNVENFGGKGTQPAIDSDHGKYQGHFGFIRASNDTNGQGVPLARLSTLDSEFFACPLTNYSPVHYGCKNKLLHADRVKVLTGSPIYEKTRIQDNYVGEHAFYGRLGASDNNNDGGGSAAGFKPQTYDCDNVVGLRVGDATNFPIGVHLGSVIILKANPSQVRTINAVDYDDLALWLSHSQNCYLKVEDALGDILWGAGTTDLYCDIDHITGDITIEAGATGYLLLPYNYAGTITDNSNGGVTIDVKGRSLAGWAQYSDTVHTSASPFQPALDTWVNVTNNAGDVYDLQKPWDIETFYDEVNGKILGKNGDDIAITIDFVAVPTSSNTTTLQLALFIGNNLGPLGDGRIYQRPLSFPRGQNVARPVSFTLEGYTLGTWQANGAILQVRTNASVNIYAKRYIIKRTRRAETQPQLTLTRS